jgi:hypothetical protein
MAPADCVGTREVPGSFSEAIDSESFSPAYMQKKGARTVHIRSSFCIIGHAIMSGEIEARPVLTRSQPYRVRLFFTGKKKESEAEPRACSFCFAIALRSVRRNMKGKKARQVQEGPAPAD